MRRENVFTTFYSATSLALATSCIEKLRGKGQASKEQALGERAWNRTVELSWHESTLSSRICTKLHGKSNSICVVCLNFAS